MSDTPDDAPFSERHFAAIGRVAVAAVALDGALHSVLHDIIPGEAPWIVLQGQTTETLIDRLREMLKYGGELPLFAHENKLDDDPRVTAFLAALDTAKDRVGWRNNVIHGEWRDTRFMDADAKQNEF